MSANFVGCSSEINPKNGSFKFDGSKIASAGLCQELCLERIGSNRINWFALRVLSDAHFLNFNN